VRSGSGGIASFQLKKLKYRIKVFGTHLSVAGGDQ
jgi:hypothetical protein